MAFQYYGSSTPQQPGVNPFRVQPGADFGQGLADLGTSLEEAEEKKYERELKEREIKREEAAMQKAADRFQSAKAAMQTAMASGEPNEIANVSIEYPEFQEMFRKVIDYKSEATEANHKSAMLAMMNKPSREVLAKEVDTRMGVLDKEGVLNNEMTAMALEKYDADPDGYTRGIEQTFAGMYPKEWEAWKKAKDGEGAIGDDPQVQSSQILTDGSIIKVMKDGKVEVENPEGEIVTGVDRSLAIEEANKAQIAQTGGGAYARATGTQEALFKLQGLVAANKITQENAAKAANDMHDQLAGIRKKRYYMDETIRLLDAGAQTGPVMKRLPTFKAASMELENIQAKLGLNVIQNTTFGSLSEAELKFALSAALPTGLNEAELRDWAIRKRDVIILLEDYLKSAALYLNIPGNTRSGWEESQKNKVPATQTQEEQSQGSDPLGIR